MIQHRILFVCLGNTCRSPIAEGVLRDLASRSGHVDQLLVDSAGTSLWHLGEPPDPRAQAVAARRGIDISGRRARKIVRDDFRQFDRIVAMDRANYDFLRHTGPEGGQRRLHLLLDYLGVNGLRDVPDPCRAGASRFEEAFELIERGCQALLASLEGVSYRPAPIVRQSSSAWFQGSLPVSSSSAVADPVRG